MREFIVRVRIDTTTDTKTVHDSKPMDGIYTVLVNPNDLARMGTKPIIALAHELGHVLGLEFELPAHKTVGDIAEKVGHENAGYIASHLSGDLLRRENEAWDLAEEMFRFRRIAIKSYEEGQARVRAAVATEKLLRILGSRL